MTIENNGLMQGKRGVIMGLANDRSIAWGIAKALANQGAELALTYQGDAMKKRVMPLAEQLGAKLVLSCDVGDDAQMDQTFAQIEQEWGQLDFLVHAIGFSNKDELKGMYLDTSRDNFIMSMDISVYSFTALAKRAAPLMKEGGGMLTLTYHGSTQVMPNYNVMGVAKAALEASVRYLAADLGRDNIRVNAISAGPIKTLAGSGIGDFRAILRWNELNAPLKRTVSIDDVGNSSLYLLSDLGRSVTGEIHYVDSGYNAVGMIAPDAAGDLAELLASMAPKYSADKS